ncbi:MAG: isoleucine-tRNA ligase, partial [Actinomycetota bacterium]|jgi:isoleucyl-tRNA synthetase
MDKVRAISSSAQALRKGAGLRVRLPLAKLTVVTKNANLLSDFSSILTDELNVKAVDLVELSLDSTSEFGVTKRLTVNSRAAGPRIGKDVQAVIAAAKSGNWVEDGGSVVAGGIALIEGEYEIDLVADTDAEQNATNHIGILAGGGFLILDGKLTPELEAEGLARDVIRAVQQARKDADLDVSDRIALSLTGSAEVIAAVGAHQALVMAETLTLQLETKEEPVSAGATVGNDLFVAIKVAKLG